MVLKRYLDQSPDAITVRTERCRVLANGTRLIAIGVLVAAVIAPVVLPVYCIIGFGAFGRLMARHLQPHFRLCAYDPAPPLGAFGKAEDVTFTSLPVLAGCPVVILAMPVNRLEETVQAIASHLRPGMLVLDVGLNKMVPAEIMRHGLPDHVEIVATHLCSSRKAPATASRV